MRKIWDKIVGWLTVIPIDKWLHFIAGMFIASFFAIALGRLVIVCLGWLHLWWF